MKPCPIWCGIWYWTAKPGAKPRKTVKPYTGETSWVRRRELHFCSLECAQVGTALNPTATVVGPGWAS